MHNSDYKVKNKLNAAFLAHIAFETFARRLTAKVNFAYVYLCCRHS